MLHKILLFFCSIYSVTICIESARILGIFPIPSISHQVVFRALTLELAKRGHELVVITSDPALPKERPPDNITEIDTGHTYQMLAEVMHQGKGQNLLKRGVIMDADAAAGMDLMKGVLDIILYQMDLPEVKKIIEDDTQKFDLVILEAMMNYPLVIAKKFNAPVILFSSLYGFPESYTTMGAIGCHPLFYPSYFRTKYRDLSLWDKIYQSYLEFKLSRIFKAAEMMEDNALKERYGPDAPTIADMRDNIQMLFLNSYPIIANNRPVPPSVVFLGGLQLQPVKPLPEDLKSYLNKSTRGVVYVSLGTNVRLSMMDKDFFDAFLEAFEAVPYDVLWKVDGVELDREIKNLKTQKWFPQRDLLMHPNIKVFVTQGGLQSTDEAIDAAVPLVGIPILGDQWYNVNKYVELGIGVEVDAYTMTGEDLASAIKKVANDDSYKENAKRIRAVIKDQPQTSLERAVWWTEHLLRHGGAAHLRAPTANKTWSQFLMADVLVTLLAAAIALLTVAVVAASKIINMCKRKNVKTKQN